jgi:hypothetical protein
MDKEQIKKEIEKKIDKWNGITFFTLFFLLIIVPFILNDTIPTTIGLYILLILSFIALTAFIAFSTYVYDLIEERYDDFIERENLTLKEKILDILIIIWIMSPVLATLDIFTIPSHPIPGIIFGIIIICFWLFGPFILSKDENSNKNKQS